MIEVRLWGDPFSASPESAALRAVLRVAEHEGVRCGLALTLAKLRAQTGHAGCGSDGREVVLDDGCGGELRMTTVASDADLQLLVAAAGRAVVATAPLLVFGDADAVAQAGFEFGAACLVVLAEGNPEVLLQRLRALIASHGDDPSPLELDTRALAFAVGEPAGAERLLVLASSADEHSVDPVFLALATLQRERKVQVTIATDAAEAARVRVALQRTRLLADLHTNVDAEPLLRDAAVVVLPWHGNAPRALLARALASGRAVVAPRCFATADLLADGACLPVGGVWQGDVFVPEPRHLLAQLRSALTDPSRARTLGRRGRAHVLEMARGPRPAAAAPAARTHHDRPSVVLEAPLFELSSSALLTVATARALLRADHVELWVVARGAHQVALARLRQAAPDVLARCVRQPPPQTDLWLTTGWPPRAARPAGAHTFAVRVDWEYGALPVALAPLLVQEADAVVVHSRIVEATIAAAGRPRDTIALVPHGVDGDVFHPYATPLADVVAWKRDRVAIVFAGGLIWRKGVDLLLQALLQMPARLRAQVCLVVKPMGGHTSYRGFEMGELLHRFRAAGAVDTLIVERDLTAAEMAGLYTACDVYAQPYRGEGFGLPVLEALACGLPTVVTAGGSTDDFAWGGGCLRVAAIHRDVDLPEPCLSQPWVLEPDVGSLGAALARAVGERNELRRLAVAAAPAVAARSSWDHAAAQIEALARQACQARAGGVLVAG